MRKRNRVPVSPLYPPWEARRRSRAPLPGIALAVVGVAQIYYNMLNPTAGFDLDDDDAGATWSSTDFSGLLAACRAHGVGVMNIRILAAGVLATDVRHGREAPIIANAEMQAEEARPRTMRTALGERPETRAQTAIRFGLARPAVSTVVFGVADRRSRAGERGARRARPRSARSRGARHVAASMDRRPVPDAGRRLTGGGLDGAMAGGLSDVAVQSTDARNPLRSAPNHDESPRASKGAGGTT